MSLKVLLRRNAELAADVAVLKALAMGTPEGRAAFVQSQPNQDKTETRR
jgi:hypothetical protein